MDPGLAETGWGVLQASNSSFKTQGWGCVSTKSSLSIEERLQLIYSQISQVVAKYQPEVAAVESLFFGANAKTAMLVGQARGAVILACGERGVKVAEYTPLQIKTAVTGYGRAEKGQMQRMLKALLNLDELPQPDHAADAIACAYCHAVTKI